jgi:hypothetical protein
VVSFLFVSRLPLMACRTVDMYGMLLIHSQHIALSQGGLDYLAQALSGIRTATPTRLLFTIKTFAFLRDAIASQCTNG